MSSLFAGYYRIMPLIHGGEPGRTVRSGYSRLFAGFAIQGHMATCQPVLKYADVVR
jgi:hypothetical protein